MFVYCQNFFLRNVGDIGDVGDVNVFTCFLLQNLFSSNMLGMFGKSLVCGCKNLFSLRDVGDVGDVCDINDIACFWLPK